MTSWASKIRPPHIPGYETFLEYYLPTDQLRGAIRDPDYPAYSFYIIIEHTAAEDKAYLLHAFQQAAEQLRRHINGVLGQTAGQVSSYPEHSPPRGRENPYDPTYDRFLRGLQFGGHEENEEEQAELGIRVGALIGWRAWKIFPHERTLRSLWTKTRWPSNEPLEANVFEAGHKKDSGIYAYKSAKFLKGFISKSMMENIICGEVELWGNIVEHEFGYRAQFAKVKSLYSAAVHPEVLAEVKEKYGLA